MSKRLLSMLLALVMVFSLATPLIPVAAAETDTGTTSEEPASDLRIGVLSDIHVSYDYVDEVYGNVSGYFNGVQPSRFEKALRFFKSKGVDAVVIAGDLQEASGTDEASLDKQKDWLQTVVDIWFEVFPEKQGEEGYVEPIFTYGNHDSALVSAQYWPEEWGTYEDVFIKEVNGYSFVCTHNAKENLAAPLLEKVAATNQDKPIFYIQHCPVNNTVPNSTSGYGVGYGQNGWKNVAPYHNAVVFNGHTHVPLTDERSIWQGDEGNEGQFTVINTATINYTGLGNDDMSVNSYAGNAQQTEHGLLVDVTGSELSVERYSFNDMVLNDDNTVSGEADKIGETWQWDACDITDRPYAYDSRYENANAPEFADGASVTVDTVTDTSVTVTIPTASIEAPSGFSDLVEAYVVEACNPTSGEVEATGRIATSYHIDDETFRFQDTYTVTVSGLKAGTSYTLKVYAQEFFDKRSEPIEVSITTTGNLTAYRVGDINYDGAIDQTDMECLQAILSDSTALYNAAADIDANGVLETRDIAELQAILDATRVTYPESTDLMDLVHQVKLTGVSTSTSYQPVDYGTTIQNSVVRGDSNQGVKTWTTNYAYYPVTTMYFSEPVDLSGYTHFSFDTLFENEYNLSDSYRKRWLSVSFISGNQEQIASYGSMNFDSGENGWETKVISLATLKNIDLTAVTGIRFSHNFDYYEGRYDGVTEHAIYWDNFHGLVIEGDDADLLSGASVTGGEIVFGAGYTNNTNQAILSTGGTLDFAFKTEKVLTDYAAVKVDVRTPISTTVQVQPFDAEGNLLGMPIAVDSCYIYQSVSASVAAMGLAEGTVVAGLRFTYSCDYLLLDNMSLQGSKDYDLIGTASSFNPLGGSNCTAMITTEGGNGSNNALYASAAPGTSVWNGGGELVYDTPLDLSETPYLRLDIKVENAHWAFNVCLYNSAGEVIWKTLHYNATSSGGQYATYEFDLRTYRTHDSETGYTNHEVTAEQLKDVAKITLTADLASSPNWMTSDDTALREVWFDNLVACNPLEDFFGASTSLIGPSAVQNDFVCEIMPSTADGHTNVMHWYSDPENNGGTTSNAPGETRVTIQKDVKRMNHSGYDGSVYDYVEFTVKTTGSYCAFYLSFLDASGTTLGSSAEYRISLGMEWSTFRIDLNTLGLTAEEIANIQTVSINWNWMYQNVNGTETKKVADIYIDNMGFCSVPEESTDLLDQVTKSSAFGRWWYSANNTYPGAGWLFQSDVTANSDTAFMFYRSPETSNMGYSVREHLHYFQSPITVEEDWLLSMDVINNNFRVGTSISVIGSDGKYYSCFTMDKTGTYSVQTAVSQLATTDGTVFDPDTTTINGLIYYTNFNPDANVDQTIGGYLVYDNLNITIGETPDPEPSEPEPTEPDTTEPEVTVDPVSPNPEDPGDMLGASNSVAYNHDHWDNYNGSETGLTAQVDTENIYGTDSTRSWSFKATSAANKSEAVAQFAMPSVYDMTGKLLVFDVKFDSSDAAQTLTLKTRLHETVTWNDVSTNISKTLKAGYWQTVALDFSGNIVSGKDLTQVQQITFTMNFASNTGTERAVYIDNLRLVDPETLEDDLIHCKVDSGSSGNLYWLTDEHTYGDSTLSMRVENKTAGDTDIYYSPQSQYGNDALPNYKDKLFCADFYFGDQTPYATLALVDKGWSGMTATKFVFEDLGDGWYRGTANTTSVSTHAETTDFSQVIRFAINLASGAVAYIDNLEVVEGETVAQDWINIPVDSGSTKGTAGWVNSHTYGDSNISLMYTAVDGAYLIMNTENETRVKGGSWTELVNMNEGIFGFDVYFGDQTPGVMIHLISATEAGGTWVHSSKVAMTLEELGEGWYHASINMSALTTDAGYDAYGVKRIYLYFTAGQTVYIDNMHLLPAPNNMEDHLLNSPGVCRPTSGIEDGYVIEILDSYDGYKNVFHVNSDPNNGGGTTTNWPNQPSYYVAESGAQYDASDYDYYEFSFKGTGHYSDISVSFLDESGTTLGSVSGFRMSHKEADWMTFRIDVATAGLTADEIKLVRRVSFGFNWQYQNSTGTALLEADLYWANCGFGCNDEESTDLLDQINLIKNSDYWYGGYNNYPGAGWYFDAEDAFTFFRSPETSGLGYADRNMYVYFKTPVAVENGQRLSLDIVSTNFPKKSRLEVIGSDGKYYAFGSANQAGSYNLTVCVNDLVTSDGIAFDPATVTIKGLKFYNNFNPDTTIDTTVGGTLAYTGLTVLPALPNALDDAIANYSSLTTPTHVEDGFVCEVLAETEDGHTNVLHWYTDPNNGAGTTSNWPDTTKLYIDVIPSYVDATQYDYLEFSYKHYGVKYWFSLTVYDTAGTKIGASTGTAHSGYTEWRTGDESGWATHRIDLDTMGLTAEELLTIGMFEISVSWEYNNVNGSKLYKGEMWIDDLRFGCIDESSTDLLDQIVETDIYSANSANCMFADSDWYWDEDGTFVITRGTDSAGWVDNSLYFDEAITVESDWMLSCDFDITSFHHGGSVSLIGSDGNIYTSLAPNATGQKTVTKTITEFVNGSTAFDPATVQIVGIRLTYSLSTTTVMTDTTYGYMSLDNLILTDPSAE